MSHSPAVRYELWKEDDNYSFLPEDNHSAKRLLIPKAELVWSCDANSFDEALVKKDLFLGFKVAYQDGAEVLVGDFVLIENGRVKAAVVEVICTAKQQEEWGVELPGVMLKSEPFGLLYLPTKFLAEEPLQFVSRP